MIKSIYMNRTLLYNNLDKLYKAGTGIIEVSIAFLNLSEQIIEIAKSNNNKDID